MSDADRRSLLKALALIAVPDLGCAPGEPPPPSVPLAELDGGARIVVQVRDDPVEVRKTEAGIEARSLLCTHMGCQVKWHPEQNEYRCPCHEGRYDATGDVIEGMPTGPLRHVGFELRDDAVVFPVSS